MSDAATLRAELDQTVRDLEHLLLVSERKVNASALAVAEHQINCLRRRLGDLGATDHRPPTTGTTPLTRGGGRRENSPDSPGPPG